jgi:hypothetical protein
MPDYTYWDERALLALSEAVRATTRLFQEALQIMVDDASPAVAAAPCSASAMPPDAGSPARQVLNVFRVRETIEPAE